MKDFRGRSIRKGDAIIWVTVHGHKPILHYGRVLEVEPERIKVGQREQSYTPYPTEPRCHVWLHTPANMMVMLWP